MTEHIYTYDNPPSQKDLSLSCSVLSADGVIAYPTDINWAFGCDSTNTRAIDKIRLLKPYHPKEHPFSLICSSISMASEYVNISHNTYRYLRKMWPGPYTVILQRSRNLVRQLNDKRKVVGIRIPQSPLLMALVEKLGRPLITTSIPNAKDGSSIKFGHQIYETYKNRLDLILDLGVELSGEESTVVDFSQGDSSPPIIVREGAGSVEDVFGI